MAAKPNIRFVFLVVFFLLVAAALVTYLKFRSSPPPQTQTAQIPKAEGPCPGETKSLINRDPYMPGTLEKEQRFDVITNYYACNPLRRGDLVYFRFSFDMEPVVRKVVALEGDTFELSPDKEKHRWNLIVNGEMITAATGNYFFGAETPPTLSLYVKARNGILRAQEAIVLSTRPPGDFDSGTLGIVSVKDFLGKVIPH